MHEPKIISKFLSDPGPGLVEDLMNQPKYADDADYADQADQAKKADQVDYADYADYAD